MTTRMFTHTGPRRGDVFAESTFAKQIAMIEAGLIPPIVKTGNLNSLRTWADVRDAVRAYYMLVTINPTPGEFYNIGGTKTRTIKKCWTSLFRYLPPKTSLSRPTHQGFVLWMRMPKFRTQANSLPIQVGNQKFLSKQQ